MTNNQINYWKVESERDKWQAENKVALMNAETQRNSQIEQARHNLIEEDLKRALNDIDREYKEQVVQIDREYKQRMAAVNEQANRIQARKVEIDRMLGETSNRIASARNTETLRHDYAMEQNQSYETSHNVRLTDAKASESRSTAGYNDARADLTRHEVDWYNFNQVVGTIDKAVGWYGTLSKSKTDKANALINGIKVLKPGRR